MLDFLENARETAIPSHSSAQRPSMSNGEALFSNAKRKGHFHEVSTMPIFASGPATTVRQRSPWLIPKPVYGAVFLPVALAAYGWCFFGSRPLKVDLPLPATAKVCIHRPNFAFQNAWQEVLAQAKSEVRENLHVEANGPAKRPWWRFP